MIGYSIIRSFPYHARFATSNCSKIVVGCYHCRYHLRLSCSNFLFWVSSLSTVASLFFCHWISLYTLLFLLFLLWQETCVEQVLLSLLHTFRLGVVSKICVKQMLLLLLRERGGDFAKDESATNAFSGGNVSPMILRNRRVFFFSRYLRGPSRFSFRVWRSLFFVVKPETHGGFVIAVNGLRMDVWPWFLGFLGRRFCSLCRLWIPSLRPSYARSGFRLEVVRNSCKVLARLGILDPESVIQNPDYIKKLTSVSSSVEDWLAILWLPPLDCPINRTFVENDFRLFLSA